MIAPVVARYRGRRVAARPRLEKLLGGQWVEVADRGDLVRATTPFAWGTDPTDGVRRTAASLLFDVTGDAALAVILTPMFVRHGVRGWNGDRFQVHASWVRNWADKRRDRMLTRAEYRSQRERYQALAGRDAAT